MCFSFCQIQLDGLIYSSNLKQKHAYCPEIQTRLSIRTGFASSAAGLNKCVLAREDVKIFLRLWFHF